MRAFLFNTLYWGMSGIYAILCAVVGLIPGRFFLMHGVRSYTRFTVFLMRHVAGIKVEVRGTPPRNQPVIIAAKHQSWGDGIAMMAKTGDINFVVGDHMLKFPLIGWILTRAGAIVVNNGGGRKSIEALKDGIHRSHGEMRPILIYPEGHLTEVGETKPFRKGVYRLYAMLDRPVVPVATNLGLFWPRQDWAKHPGTAVIEFLDPIAPGLSKEDFMRTLEDRVSARTRELEAEGRS
ncbi:1-acyl-sn-glycerol-3-phosphate acyltransferase [Hyphobacterium sp. SN044]|uniref:lysophospholipid acyltransferase family protein n=1 Tax=Hyphobacterium sp. SN044 TaxID=2912575 RepID=UPI001F3BDA08|nr:lysophospholipid acyltransferase family protein [Hyphobacterium sp. SN044]MCF8878735.1 1-acyl-sn-glycerol-3-phosphate acyltransferase [Hyphobacterium sp. SN044]